MGSWLGRYLLAWNLVRRAWFGWLVELALRAEGMGLAVETGPAGILERIGLIVVLERVELVVAPELAGLIVVLERGELAGLVEGFVGLG